MIVVVYNSKGNPSCYDRVTGLDYYPKAERLEIKRAGSPPLNFDLTIGELAHISVLSVDGDVRHG